MKQELLDKYNVPVPRYTSYPPANYFHDGFNDYDYADALQASNNQKPELISIFLSATASVTIADAIPIPFRKEKS